MFWTIFLFCYFVVTENNNVHLSPNMYLPDYLPFLVYHMMCELSGTHHICLFLNVHIL